MSNNSSSPECAFCGRGLTVPILKNIPKNGSVYDVSECADCEIAMIHPLPSDAELTRLYSCGNYRTDEGKRFGPLIETLILFSRILKRRSINRFVKPGKILDIGCGRGLFLDVMRRGGWRAIGTELNKETASYAIKVYDLKILAGGVIQHQLPDEGLDAININQVLEHLKNPKEVIEECHRILRKDGLLVISVPDLRSPQFTLGKKTGFF